MSENLRCSDGSVRKVPRIKMAAVSRYVPPAFRQIAPSQEQQRCTKFSSVSYLRSLQSLAHSRSGLGIIVLVAQTSESKFDSWISSLENLVESVEKGELRDGVLSASLHVEYEDDDSSDGQWAFSVVNWFASSEQVTGAELRFDVLLSARERAQLHHLAQKDSRLIAFSRGQGSARFLTMSQADEKCSPVKTNLCPTESEQTMIDGIKMRFLDNGSGKIPGISELLSLIRAPGGLEQSSPLLYQYWQEVQRREQVVSNLANACKSGDFAVVKDLIEENRWALFVTPKTRAPLTCAVVAGHVSIVQLLLSHGVPTSSFCAIQHLTMLELSRRSPVASRAAMVALFSTT